MSREELPNGWTWEEALKEADLRIQAETRPCGTVWAAARRVLAHHIAQHEKPPVDPDLMLMVDVMKIFDYRTTARWILDGNLPEQTEKALKLLKERRQQ